MGIVIDSSPSDALRLQLNTLMDTLILSNLLQHFRAVVIIQILCQDSSALICPREAVG